MWLGSRPEVVMLLVMVVMMASLSAATRRPNIVLVLTDDQDTTMGSTAPLAVARKIIAEAGVEFVNAFTTSPICCPSRASILTGRYLHNTGQSATHRASEQQTILRLRKDNYYAVAPCLLSLCPLISSGELVTHYLLVRMIFTSINRKCLT